MIAIAMGCCVAMMNFTLASAAPEKPILEEFPIAAWGRGVLDNAVLKEYQAAHFNIVQVPAGNTDAIRRAGADGFRALLTHPESTGESPAEWAKYASKFKNAMGWALGNAITKAQTPQVAGWIKALRAADRRRWPLASIPPSAGGSWGTTMSALLEAGLPAILVEHPGFPADGKDKMDGYYTDLEAVRRISLKTHVPLWAVVQVARSGQSRWASASDLRFQVYTYLAAGAKGVCYLTRWPSLADLAKAAPDDGEETPDNARLNGRIRYEMDSIRDLNREVKTLGPALLTLQSTGLYFVGNVPAGLPTLQGSGQAITSVTAEAAIVGMFSDPQGHPWALVVNARHGKMRSAPGQKSTMRVSMSKQVKRVVEVDRATAYEKEIPLASGSFLITIPGGTGSLLRIEMEGTTPSGPVPEGGVVKR